MAASPSPVRAALTAAILLLAFSVAACSTSSASSTCHFPAIFNFGDSNSDTGGLSATFGPAPPPYGETFFGRPSGRNSDGRLIIDFMAENLGLPYLSAYLDSIGTSFSHGANFASAGATIRRPNGTISQTNQSPFSLEVQVKEFAQFKNRSQQVQEPFKTLMPKADYFSRALYTFDMGQNDLTFGFFHNQTAEDVKAYAPDVVDKFVASVKSIYDLGGRYFWIHSTSPLGCLPYVPARVPVPSTELDAAGCGVPFNEAARHFNALLRGAVVKLRKDLTAASFVYVDMYSVKYELISQASRYGFELPLEACCGSGGGKYNFDNSARCGAKAVVNGTEVALYTTCANPGKRISWDGIHLTDAADKWVFERIANGAFSDPPLPLRKACHGMESYDCAG